MTARPALRFFPRKDAARPNPDGVWFGKTDGGIYLRVAGTEDAPYPVLAPRFWHLVDHLDETMETIAAHVASLPPDTRIPFEHKPKEAIGARICGFQGPIWCLAVAVVEPAASASATIEFITGEPDGYVSFGIELDDGVPGAIVALLS